MTNLLILILGFILGVATGGYSVIFYINYKIKKQDRIVRKELNSIYKQLKINVENNEAVFVFRINNHIRLDTKLNGESVNIYFYTNKNDISIFKNEEVLYTSGLVDKYIMDNLNFLLKTKYSIEINDTVNVFGMVYSKNYFIKTFNVNSFYFENNINVSDVDVNESDLDIDSILDKINIVGYENLSHEEKEFLKKSSNN
jgi:hypothetical protein